MFNMYAIRNKCVQFCIDNTIVTIDDECEDGTSK